MRAFYLASSLLLCLLTGCAVVTSTKISNVASSSGTVYYLPIRPMKLEFVRTPTNTKPEVDKAKAAVDSAKDALDKAKKALDVAKSRRDATTVGTPARSESDKIVDLATADVKVAENEFKECETKLANATADHLRTVNGKPPLTDSITVTLLPSIADTRHRYSAELSHLFTRNDKFELKTTQAGLLNTSNSTADDQSAQILISLAQSLAAIGGIGPGVTPGLGLTAKQSFTTEQKVPTEKKPAAQPVINCDNGFYRLGSKDPEPFKFEYVFDPTQATVTQKMIIDGKYEDVALSPWEYIQSSLCSLGADYMFQWQPLGATINSQNEPIKKDENSAWPGLFYRRQLPYTLSIYAGRREVKETQTVWTSLAQLKTAQVELPNASPPELLNMQGTAFASRDFSTEFQDGLLVSHKEVKPSEALSIVSLPYNITKAIISIPAEIISLKVDYSSKEASFLENKTLILKNQKAYQDALDGKFKE